MKFPLTEQLLDEARRFELRSACRDCFYWSERRGECWHGWPDEGQRRWPLDATGLRPAPRAAPAGSPPHDSLTLIDAPGPDGERPTTVAFCKEFELR